jgi:hypothetical protein
MNKSRSINHNCAHDIAVFRDGVFVRTMTTAEIKDAYGIREATLRSKMAHGTPWHGLYFIDLDDWPRGVCPGCILECERPWPCSAAVRAFTKRYRHHRGNKPIDITEGGVEP